VQLVVERVVRLSSISERETLPIIRTLHVVGNTQVRLMYKVYTLNIEECLYQKQ